MLSFHRIEALSKYSPMLDAVSIKRLLHNNYLQKRDLKVYIKYE